LYWEFLSKSVLKTQNVLKFNDLSGTLHEDLT